MKNLLMFASLLVFVACGQAPTGERVEAQDAQEATAPTETAKTLAVDTQQSTISWVGSKKIGDQHTGTIGLADGSLSVEGGQLTGGKFTIDMSKLTNTDLEGEYQQKLVGHLMSDDFFAVGTYPTTTFEITSVEAVTDNTDATHNITGNLTMRETTKSITIPAKVSMTDGGIIATTPDFVINRTDWGVSFGSSTLGVVGDNIINDEIGLQITLTAK